MSEIQQKKTVLYEMHKEHGAKFTDFSGFLMPLNYQQGSLNEHIHTRSEVSFFDVSHMSQVILTGTNFESLFEKVVPSDIKNLKNNCMRYTMFTNSNGGVIDDLMVTKRETGLHLVLNASRKKVDIEHLQSNFGNKINIKDLSGFSLFAIQGPKSLEVLMRHCKDLKYLEFMQSTLVNILGIEIFVMRSGYTGEVGFEISVQNSHANDLASILLAEPEVKLAGLAARDLLRLEAGFCLYGKDLTESITPIEAGLGWTISKRRRIEGGFHGDSKIQKQLSDGVKNKRVGLKLLHKSIAREGAIVSLANKEFYGIVSSGGFSPFLDMPIAMAYVSSEKNINLDKVFVEVRGKLIPAKLVQMPFVSHKSNMKLN